MIKILVFIFSILIHNYISYLYTENCISVGPGGISGYWFFINKLKNYNDNQDFTCASSGCLAVVAKNIDFNQSYKIAKNIKYNTGNFEKIKNNFIYNLANNINKIPRISIITMDLMGNCFKTKPNNKKELVELLILTTNVPLITTTKKHIDGGICYYIQNYCNKKIYLPVNYKFVLHIFNYNMGLKDVLYYYNYNN